jgi:hypothetical protein
VYSAKANTASAREVALLGYRDLSQDLYMVKNEHQRLARLKEIAEKEGN